MREAMTDIIFSFDTEDFTSCPAADAILREAEILREEDIRGCFCMVGLLAGQLENWKRDDVLEALKHHEIATHSYGHTLHPLINEYTDIEDFEAARAEVFRQETEAIRLIRHATGADTIYAACPPGNQKSYVAMYTYADMGIPIYADTVCDTPDGRGVYYCNIFHVRYTCSFEKKLMREDEQGKNAACELDDMQKLLDELAQKKRAIIFTHPNVAMFSEFWDAVNYHKVNSCPFGQWKECRRRPEEETEAFYQKIRMLVKLIKQDKRFRITTYSELAAELKMEGERVVSQADIPLLRKSLEENFFPVTEPCSLSIADMFLACRDLLVGKTEHVCGKVYGFLERPAAISEQVILSAEAIKESAEQMDTGGFLPHAISVGDCVIGPGDWLRAAMGVLCGGKEIALTPGPQLPSLDQLPQLRECSFKGQWQQSDEFEDKYLSERLRLQAWTMRFLAEGRKNGGD